MFPLYDTILRKIATKPNLPISGEELALKISSISDNETLKLIFTLAHVHSASTPTTTYSVKNFFESTKDLCEVSITLTRDLARILDEFCSLHGAKATRKKSFCKKIPRETILVVLNRSDLEDVIRTYRTTSDIIYCEENGPVEPKQKTRIEELFIEERFKGIVVPKSHSSETEKCDFCHLLGSDLKIEEFRWCSYNCALAHYRASRPVSYEKLLDHFTRYMALPKEFFFNVKPSPSPLLMETFGGEFTDSEYRLHIQKNTFRNVLNACV